MKKKSILGFLLCLLGLGMTTTSCEDMLTPDMDRYAENFTGKDTVNFYLGIMTNVQSMIEQNVLLGDLRSDLVNTTMYSSDSIADIINFKATPDGENALLNRSAYYKVINQCNFYLSKVDSMASKNNNYYMRKEMAQVLLVRAWTYMQLVQNYGRVPYITLPVSSANTGWETNPENWATPDNLLDLCQKDCEQALAYQKAYGYPDYGTFETGNGSVSIDHTAMIFPADLVLGDLYLLRGANKADYVQAAKYYYEFFKDQQDRKTAREVGADYQATYNARISMSGGSRQETYTPNVSSFNSLYSSSSTGSPYEMITIVPSAANSVFGQVLTRIPQIYGFDPHSTNSTETGDDDASTTSGTVSITANYKSQQVTCSPRYEMLNKSQEYTYIEEDNTGNLQSLDYLSEGDARYYGTMPEVRTTEGRVRFMHKFGAGRADEGTANSSSFQFRYIIGVYRTQQVWLRFAEAINRAGYPHYAFAILHGGIDDEIMPSAIVRDTIYDDEAKTATPVYGIDSIVGNLNFIPADEIRRAQADPNYSVMLDFSQDGISSGYGIHDLGCMNLGKTYKYYEQDSINDYGCRVAQRIEDEAVRRGNYTTELRKKVSALRHGKKVAYAMEEDDNNDKLDSLRKEYTVLEPAQPAEADPLEIDAVESLIADEGALALGFEGYRYYDLMRIARHKNADTSGLFPGTNGTSWFAWQIARRDQSLKIYEQPNIYDATIYNNLLNTENWYLVNPEY